MAQPFSSTKRNDPTTGLTLLECVQIYIEVERFFIVLCALSEGVAFVLGLLCYGLVICFELLCALVSGVLFVLGVVGSAIAAVFAIFSC
jgi:hypothetical protein